jgi:hypothetical protein
MFDLFAPSLGLLSVMFVTVEVQSADFQQDEQDHHKGPDGLLRPAHLF